MQLERVRPQDNAVFRERGMARLRAKDAAKAVDELSSAIRIDGEDIIALKLRAKIYEQAKLYDKALAAGRRWWL